MTFGEINYFCVGMLIGGFVGVIITTIFWVIP